MFSRLDYRHTSSQNHITLVFSEQVYPCGWEDRVRWLTITQQFAGSNIRDGWTYPISLDFYANAGTVYGGMSLNFGTIEMHMSMRSELRGSRFTRTSQMRMKPFYDGTARGSIIQEV